jgi:hypothetical protein
MHCVHISQSLPYKACTLHYGQLKLRAVLLDIRPTHVTAERDCGTQAEEQEAQGQARASEELFRHMQKQPNNCIRHHQEINRRGYIH